MSQEAVPTTLFNFSEYSTDALGKRYEELRRSIATGTHGEQRTRSLTMETTQVGFEQFWRSAEQVPGGLVAILGAELSIDESVDA